MTPAKQDELKIMLMATLLGGMLANNDGINRTWENIRQTNPNASLDDRTEAMEKYLCERAASMAEKIVGPL